MAMATAVAASSHLHVDILPSFLHPSLTWCLARFHHPRRPEFPVKFCVSPGMAFRAFPLPKVERRRFVTEEVLAVNEAMEEEQQQQGEEEDNEEEEDEEKERFFDLPALPFTVNPSLTVVNWGTIYRGPREEKYWNSSKNHPYPVGYTAIKNYKGRTFRQSVAQSSNGPLFVVEESDGKAATSADSPTKVWNALVRADGRVHGSRHFGFQTPEILNVLRAMKKPARSSYEKEHHVMEAQHRVTETEISREELVSEEEQDYVDNEGILEDDLTSDVYSRHIINEDVQDDSPGYENSDSFGSPPKTGADKISMMNDELEKYDVLSSQHSMEEASENDMNDVGAANHGAYHHSSLRTKTAGTAQVWRRGEGLTGPGISLGRPHAFEKAGGEHWSSYGDQAWNTNGVKSWDGFVSRKKDENPKSSQLLLELLQKWNKIKKWNPTSGERLRGRGENKRFRLPEDSDMGKDSMYEDELGGERSRISVNRQNFESETNFSGLRGSPSLMRKLETMQGGSFSDEGYPAVEELRFSNNVDESTNYAIGRLFETVGKKGTVLADQKSQSVLGKSMEEAEMLHREEKSLNHVASSWLDETLDTKASMQVQSELKPLSFQENRVVTDRISETFKNKTGNEVVSLAETLEQGIDSFGGESTNDRAGKTAELAVKKNVMRRKGAEETKLIEDVKKLVLNKRFDEAISVVRRMRLTGVAVDEDVYEAVMGFKFDPWQKNVFKQLQDGNSVLVSAPNGAGKSSAAECCLCRNVVEDRRALFVTSHEHLAEQAMHKFGTMFGHSTVGGLWTGMKVQTGSKLVVMTLETLAKVLQELNGPGGSEFSFLFEGIDLIVLDKFHTIGDAKYGSLWEEILLLMDAKIRIVALSLPANNEDQVVSWIDTSRGPCKLVSCKFDPVPKRYLFCHNSGLLPLLDPKGLQVNHVFSEANGGYDSSMTKEQLESFFTCGYDKPSLRYAFSILEDNLMLPVLVVFLNVESCDDALLDAIEVLGDGLLSKAEIEKIESNLAELGGSHPGLLNLIDEVDREALCKGFAVYNEGKLPFWQDFVLKLFQENLLKLLIVTGNTLLHTEMVVRSTILPVVCEVLKDGVTPILFEQVSQLIGSAGRRGHDIEGNVVFLKSAYSGPKEMASLLLNSVLNISPCFKPSYSLLVNLLATHNLLEVKKMLSQTFSEYVFHSTQVKAKRLEELDQKVFDCLESKADLEVKLFQGLAEVNKLKLSDAAMFTRVDIRMTIHSASHSSNALPGFLLAAVPRQAETFYMVFGLDNKFRLLPAGALDHVYTKEVPPLDVVYKLATGQVLQPPLIPPKENWTLEDEGTFGYVASGNSQTKEYVKLLMEHPIQLNFAKEGLQLRKEIQALEAQISNLIENRRNLRTQKQNSYLKSHGVENTEEGTLSICHVDQSETWKESLRLLKVLERVDALSICQSQEAHVKLKPLGMFISRLHNVENELWLAMVVTSEYVKPLLPAEFASVISTMVPQKPEVESIATDKRQLLYKVTKPVKDAFAKLEILRKHVAVLQGSYHPPLHFDTGLANMVYTWARGKPGVGSLYIESTSDGDIMCKLETVATLANLIHQACSEIAVDNSESNNFHNISTLAMRAERLLLRCLTAVDSKT